MSSKEEPRIKINWRTNEPSSAWRRLVAKIFTGRKKPSDSHVDAGKGQELSE